MKTRKDFWSTPTSRVKLAWTLRQVKKKHIALDTNEVKGWFIWICICNVVMRVVGYHFRRGFITDVCYGKKRPWVKDLIRSLFSRRGSIHITRFI